MMPIITSYRKVFTPLYAIALFMENRVIEDGYSIKPTRVSAGLGRAYATELTATIAIITRNRILTKAFFM